MGRRREPRFRNVGIASKSVAGLSSEQRNAFLSKHLANANLQSAPLTPEQAESGDQFFHDNSDFWHQINSSLRLQVRNIHLRDFQIVDWFPRTPGMYHTREAIRSRREAEQFARIEHGIEYYSPEGKSKMVLGGLGSVRFKPIMIDGSEYWLCTATSDGMCHTGIPLAMPDDLLAKTDHRLNAVWDLKGTVKLLPEFLDHHFDHHRGVHQIYVKVDEVIDKTNIRTRRYFRPVEISPIVYFSSEREVGEDFRRRRDVEDLYRYQERSVGNVSYVRCKANSLDEMSLAIEWLDWYVDKYNGEIVTNFDQQRPTFKNAPFSLQNVMTGRLKVSDLERFGIWNATVVVDTINSINAEKVDMSNSEINTGDQYHVGQAGAVGRGAKAENITFNQIQMNQQNDVDINELSSELSRLREALLSNANEPEHYVEIGAVAEAEAEAKQGNKSKSFEALTKVGKWTLDAATTIGTRVAAEAIKISLGM